MFPLSLIKINLYLLPHLNNNLLSLYAVCLRGQSHDYLNKLFLYTFYLDSDFDAILYASFITFIEIV